MVAEPAASCHPVTGLLWQARPCPVLDSSMLGSGFSDRVKQTGSPCPRRPKKKGLAVGQALDLAEIFGGGEEEDLHQLNSKWLSHKA